VHRGRRGSSARRAGARAASGLTPAPRPGAGCLSAVRELCFPPTETAQGGDAMAIAPAPGTSDPVDFDAVFQAEREYIAARRRETSADAVKDDLVGLALSGGGIRSATTNLGILQTLSRIDLLRHVDYLCTVSGGGYIGGCLSALLSISHASVQNPQPNQNAHDIAPPNEPFFTTTWERFPFRESVSPEPDRAELENWPGALSGKAQVRHLRTHGNFLIARKGIFARETLRAVGTLLAGILYHVVIVLLALFVIAAAYMAISAWLAPGVCLKLHEPGLYTAGDPRCGVKAEDARMMERAKDPRSALVRAVSRDVSTDTVWRHLTRNASSLSAAARDAGMRQSPLAALGRAAAIGAGLGIVGYLIFWTIIAGERPTVTLKEGESEDDAFARNAVRIVAWTAVGSIIYWVVTIRNDVSDGHGLPPGDPLLWMFLPAAMVAGMWAVALAATLLLATGEYVSSWCEGTTLEPFGVRCGRLWSRPARALSGALFALSTYALVLTMACAVFPLAIYALPGSSWNLGLGAVVSAVASRLLAGMLTKEGAVRRVPFGLIRALLGLVVGAFLVLVLLLLASLLARSGDAMALLACIAGGAGFVFLLLGFFVNSNKVALHYFYRDRLIETYLRTEVVETEARPAGGVRNFMRVRHDTTEMRLSDLHGSAEQGSTAPYQLISAAINIADQKDLTRKDRKSGYFLFSKLYCGSVHTGYLRTRDYAGGGTKLARAMTISGAAFASAMGYQTFFAQAFASTMFNIRLGYWMDNPADEPTILRYRRTREWLVFWPWQLLKEMLSWTNARTRLVNLSDGGHTGDNVGIYPLLQRGCKIIIACDAEADGALSFGSFTEALRQAYVDLNVDVDIDLSMIRPDPKTGLSKSHCAVGRIRYPDDPKRRCWLIYLKNSRTGDEPEPVRNYATDHPAFPHETTLDQFFTDDQFESYRALGRHIAEQTFAPWPLIWTIPGDQRWHALQRHHSPFGAADHPDFQRTAAQFVAIEREFVDHLAYYEECYFAGPAYAGPLPSTAALRRLVMAQATLMEDVYLTLNLRHYANAPDNRGWMNVFRLWARSATFRQEMKAIETNFSESFVVFYRNFIKNKQPLETEPIPHPWDSIEPGIFLDAGLRELGTVAPWRL
jgi:hypothetical protein